MLVCVGVCGRVCLCDGGYSLWLDPWWDHEVSVVPGFLGRQAVSLENFLFWWLSHRRVYNGLWGRWTEIAGRDLVQHLCSYWDPCVRGQNHSSYATVL